MTNKEIIDRIQQLKKEKNAVILAHYYTRPEVQDIADYLGDSLGLSQEAGKTDADIIVFCGVHFMAETAAIISPNKKVLIPAQSAGCSLAESITGYELSEWKKANPEGKVLLWIWTGMWGDAKRCDIKKPEIAAKCEETLEKRLAEFDKPNYPRPDIVQIHVRVDHSKSGDPFAPSSTLLRKAFAKLKSLGIEAQVMPWTAGDKIETYEKLWALGPDSFSTDYPEVLDEFLCSHKKKGH